MAIADDHVPTRSSLRRDLERGGIDVCAEAANGDEAIALAETEQPDLCLLDVAMPFGGLDAAREIKRRLPSTKIVLITASPDEQGVLSAIDAGADGYLSKRTAAATLVAVIRAVAAGETAFPRQDLGRIVRRLRGIAA